MLLQACVGISVDWTKKKLVFDRPYLPDGIRHLAMRDLQIGDAVVGIMLDRAASGVRVEMTERQGDVTVEVR